VVVGNINVGGNGKTPLVIYLSNFLKQQGYRPGIVSRGYGGKAPSYPMTVQDNSDPAQCGDEPLQHYRLARDIEIAVVDGQRRQGNGLLLPAGPLREGKWRLQQVDFIVLNGGKLKKDEYLMSLEPGRLVNVKFKGQTKSLNQITGPVSAIAGIGHPKRFFDLLRNKGIKLENTLAFPDHHQYKAADIPKNTVLMTEKDAVKCAGFAQDSWWYLPVSAKLTEKFNQDFLTKLKNCS